MTTDMTPAGDSVSGPSRTDGGDELGGDERGAGGVVFDDRGRVLILRHASGDWVFPKGHVEPGESELEAALREVAEEAGVRAWCPQQDASWTTRYVNPRGARRLITWFALRSDDSVALREELFTEAGYFTPVDAAARLTHETDRRLLAAVLEAASA